MDVYTYLQGSHWLPILDWQEQSRAADMGLIVWDNFWLLLYNTYAVAPH